MAEGQAITTQATPHRVLPDSGSGASQWARTGPRLCPLWAWAPGAGRSGSLCSPRGAAAARLWWACASGFSQVFNTARGRDRISPKALYERSVKAQCYVAPPVDAQRSSTLSLIKGRQSQPIRELYSTAHSKLRKSSHVCCLGTSPSLRCHSTRCICTASEEGMASKVPCLS